MDGMKKCPDCAEMVQAEARICRFCKHEFSQPTQQTVIETPAPMAAASGTAESSRKGCWAVIAAIFVLGMIGQCVSGNNTAPNATASADGSNVQDAGEKYLTMLKREIKSLEENPRINKPLDSQGRILSETILISARATLYNKKPEKLTPEMVELRKKFKKLAVAYQVDAFPRLRAAQTKLFNKVMWEHDVEAKTSGKRNEVIRFTAAIFASNKGIKMSQESLGDTLETLRFKQSRYEWYEGASKYTYYDLETIGDDVFAIPVSNGWTKID